MIKRIILKVYFLFRLPFIFLALLVGKISGRSSGNGSGILLIRLDRIGDFVLTLPVIENLRRHYPGTRISVLVRPYLADLACVIKSIDNVIVYDNFFSTIRALRREGFSVAIDMLCDYTLKPALLTFFSGAPRRIGFEGGFRELLFTDVVRPGRAARHMTEIHLDVLKPLGVSVVETMPSIILEDAQERKDVIVVIHPGGYYPSQRWPAERFAAVAGKIVGAYDVKLIIAGGPDDEELVHYITSRLEGGNVTAVCVDLKELARILARSTLLVCNNSGPLHLAAALGIPTVSMMGPTDPVLWWPQGANQIVIRKGSRVDMISADEVFQKINDMLNVAHGIKKR